MSNHDHGPDCVHPDELSPLLIQVLQDHPDQVMGWLHNESGCWGILVNQAVAARRAQCQHPLSEYDLQLVQDRLWWLLDNLKQELAD